MERLQQDVWQQRRPLPPQDLPNTAEIGTANSLRGGRMLKTKVVLLARVLHFCNFPASGADDESGSDLRHRSVDAERIFLPPLSVKAREQKYYGDGTTRFS